MRRNYLLLFVLVTHSLLLFPVAAVKTVQKAHLAGSWYSSDKVKLTKELENYFALAKTYCKFDGAGANVVTDTVSALIVPHAGYYFSGLCAACGYQTIKQASFDRVIIIGPSHTKSFNGIALPSYDMYTTSLGDISVDTQAVSTLLNNNSAVFKKVPGVYEKEHSIEIQLPFLQYTLSSPFAIVPLIVGNVQEQAYKTIAEAIRILLSENKKTLIVVSSDFIHYGERFNYVPTFEDVAKFDTMAIQAIGNRSYTEFDSVIKKTKATICGRGAIKILLQLIEMGALGEVSSQLASYYNSAQLEKSRNGAAIDMSQLSQKVITQNAVSYASIIFKSKLTFYEEQILLRLARNAIIKVLFPDKKVDTQFEVTKNLKQIAGVFVTLKTKTGELRGCIGAIVSDRPLYEMVSHMAQSSAFHDPRFTPLKKEELEDITISITVLTPPHIVKSYTDIIIGKHGIILEKTVNGQKKSAVYLPQVAPEQGWNVPQTLESLSKKAGLGKDAWKQGCAFKVFEGFEFGE